MKKFSNSRKLRESMIVSPVSESSNRLTEDDDEELINHFGYEPTFNGDDLKTSTSEYLDIPHYEVNFENTGFDDEGVLYIDPETDGTQITVTKVDVDGSRVNYILDLSQSTPSFSVLRESNRKNLKGRFNESNKKSIREREVNSISKTLGNYLGKHVNELNKIKTKGELEDLISGALGLGNDAYVNTILDDIERQPFTRAYREVYNIFLKGDGLGVIR